MKRHQIRDARNLILGIQDEIRRSVEAKYDHRLHAILFVAQGMSSRKTAALLGDSARTVQYWVKQFKEAGFAGLVDLERSGRPKKLNESQQKEIAAALRKSPKDVGMSVALWDGKTLSAFIRTTYQIDLSVRQCQRIFQQFGSQRRKFCAII